MKTFEDLLKSASINNTGFDNTTGNTSGRILNKDGGSNVLKTGLSFFKRISLFHTLINLSIANFLLFALILFILANVLFAFIYFFLGIENLGIVSNNSSLDAFLDCFFFSTQTITTVGYGGIHPTSFATNAVASFEALFGWMAFAVLTGLLYGRFAKPKAYLLFSENALISPYKDGYALMFRIVPYKNNTLTEAEVLMNVAFKIHEHDKVVNKFLPLKTEITKISALSLNWTIVHHINEESPFWGMCKEDFFINQTEVMVFIKAFDEHFSNTVQQRTSYIADEIIHGAKFVQMFRQHDKKKTTVMELDKINDYKIL